MSTVKSKDGTIIAFEKAGKGRALILVDGALNYRGASLSGPLAEILASEFCVYTYDRRGRGESGDTQPFSVEREIEDIEALVEEAGGEAAVYGSSSGAILALDAAARLKGIRKLAVYEAPFVVDDSRSAYPPDLVETTQKLVDEGKRGDAVSLFMKTVGVPGFFVFLMRFFPNWSSMTQVAHTLPYDLSLLGDAGSGKPLSKERWAKVKIPTLVMYGGKSDIWMANAMKNLQKILSQARLQVIEGQSHILKAEAVAPTLVDFFSAS